MRTLPLVRETYSDNSSDINYTFYELAEVPVSFIIFTIVIIIISTPNMAQNV